MSQTTRSDPPASVAVVEAVSAAEGRDPMSLPLLRDAVDPEALDTLCRTSGRHTVSFEYSDSHVTIERDGSITVEVRPPISRVR